MPLFAPKKPCPHCGASEKQPRHPADYLCPQCRQPGPWASLQQVAAWEQWRAEEERRKAEMAQRKRQMELAEKAKRQRQLQAAASLTPIDIAGFITEKGERAYFGMAAKLADWTKQRGHYEGGGGIRGVSFKVPGVKGMRAYYGGVTQRQYIPGEVVWMLKDAGTAIVTNKRIVFRGQQMAVEWAYAKLVGLDVDPSNGCLLIQVSNRQKAHVLQLADYEVFETALEAAITAYQGGGTPRSAPPAASVPPPPPPPPLDLPPGR
jgi:hypothetical protein